MALNREDKADVKGAMGKAIANKVSTVTRDSIPKSNYNAKTAYKNYARFKRMSPKYPDATPKPNS